MKTPTPTNPEPAQGSEIGLERLVFFSDAVFAIAITLLALEIRLPAETHSLSNEELLRSLGAIWPKYLGYAVSFLVIGGFWMSHHRKFRFIQRYDRRLITLNLFLLMVVAFIPFPTAVLSDYGNRTATVFYALTMVAGGLLSALVWAYAAHRNRLTVELTPAQRRRELLFPLLVPAVFLLSVGLAFLDDDLAKWSWLLTAPAFWYEPKQS